MHYFVEENRNKCGIHRVQKRIRYWTECLERRWLTESWKRTTVNPEKSNFAGTWRLNSSYKHRFSLFNMRYSQARQWSCLRTAVSQHHQMQNSSENVRSVEICKEKKQRENCSEGNQRFLEDVRDCTISNFTNTWNFGRTDSSKMYLRWELGRRLRIHSSRRGCVAARMVGWFQSVKQSDVEISWEMERSEISWIHVILKIHRTSGGISSCDRCNDGSQAS